MDNCRDGVSFDSIVIARRKELGLSQSDLARALGYTAQAISKFELTKSSLPITVLPSLSKSLQCGIDYLFGGANLPSEKDYEPIDLALLGHNIRRYRMDKGLSIEKAAQLIGVSERSLGNYETGNAVMMSGAFESIIRFYGVGAELALYKKEEVSVIRTEPAKEVIKPKRQKLAWLPSVALALAAIAAIGTVSVPLLASKERGSENDATNVSSSAEESTSSSVDDSSSSSSSVYSGPAIPDTFLIVSNTLTDDNSETGDYDLFLSYPEGYSLPSSGVFFAWELTCTAADISASLPGVATATNTLTVSAITAQSCDLTIKVMMTNSVASLTREKTFRFYKKDGEVSPTHFPGLADFYAACPTAPDGRISAGTPYRIDFVFISATGKTFVYDESIYDVVLEGYMPGVSMLAETDGTPYATVTVPTTAPAGQTYDNHLSLTANFDLTHVYISDHNLLFTIV